MIELNRRDNSSIKTKFKYDEKGNRIEKTYFMLQYSSVNWNSKRTYKFDGDGNEVEERYYHFGFDMEELNKKYDENGNELEESYINSEEFFRRQYNKKYDENGNVIQSRGERYQYDSKGNLIKINVENDVYTFKYEFDINENWIKRVEYINKIPTYIVLREIEYFSENIYKDTQ